MTHRNAFLTPRGRLALAQCVVDDGWTLRRAADRFNCSPATAKKWADRYREGGEAALGDRSSRPHRCPHQLPVRRERRIIKVRFTKPRSTDESWRWPGVGMRKVPFELG
jgi:transposase-like protein